MGEVDKDKLLQRLLKKTKITSDGHYLWQGATSRKHGVMGINGNTGTGVQRIAAYIYHDLDLNNKNQFALHKNTCPYPHCWAKDCIYVGNHKNNMRDIVNKDRFRCGHDKATHGIWKLSEGRLTCRTCRRQKDNARKQSKTNTQTNKQDN